MTPEAMATGAKNAEQAIEKYTTERERKELVAEVVKALYVMSGDATIYGTCRIVVELSGLTPSGVISAKVARAFIWADLDARGVAMGASDSRG